ncbi:MAG: hypothetical protein F6K47_16995 [Symploca sp. SIO2E6]|nr:hypothetical protein [Symploca sp. SIO2E6]
MEFYSSPAVYYGNFAAIIRYDLFNQNLCVLCVFVVIPILCGLANMRDRLLPVLVIGWINRKMVAGRVLSPIFG